MSGMESPLVIHVATIGVTAYNALLAQGKYLGDNGLRVGFVFSPSPEAELLRRMGFPVKEIYISRKISPFYDLKAIYALWRYFAACRPGIVHTHTSKAGVVGRVAARMAGVPKVIHTVHGFPFHRGMPVWRYHFFLQVEKSVARITDFMFSQSLQDIADAGSLGVKPRAGSLTYIGNGVDLNKFSPGRVTPEGKRAVKEKLGLDGGEAVVTLIGRINREKGHADLVDALWLLRELPWSGLFVGPDEGHLGQVRKKIKSYGLQDRFKIFGMRQDVPDLLAVTDIYVLPSYREGLPRSLIEAQAMGIPCVATAVRGSAEVVEDGVTGLLVPPGDPAALAEALHGLLIDPLLRFKMGQAGRRRAVAHFDETTVCRRVLALYRQVIDGGEIVSAR
ncbi:MAG: glycosyltransferase family 1 protein [Peptococcaceae bacterium]|jgi:glycosyltransferase involved in cell wall biosynthesis|nr:MAG: glycosyltransferase family 1 protein [Peptococcaceae bacterium]